MLNWLRKSVNNATTNKALNSIGALQAHLDFRHELEEYVGGKSAEIHAVVTCHAGCLVGKWLHGEGGRSCSDIELVNSLCESCEEFYEAATNAMLLMNMGHTEQAKAALQGGGALVDASDRFQLNLAKLHQKYC